jgi:ubiquinone/menaquinone biosynthesis C-methylase UbiE
MGDRFDAAFDALLDDHAKTRLAALRPNLYVDAALGEEASQTSEAFSRKWLQMTHGDDAFTRMLQHQKRWYLELYGFASEAALAQYLRRCNTVIDCGAGTGNKAAWFAELSPETLIIAVDLSESVLPAAEYYAKQHANLRFVRGDIGRMGFFRDGAFDYVNCDQVIQHTEDPPAVFRELARLTRPGGELTCYVYRRKAMPRELLDEHFRTHCKTMSHDELMALSRQLTELGRMLDKADVVLDFPAIPALGIEGGRQNIQRFLYWNFLKCFWNEELGEEVSVLTNLDWYSPSQAARYSETEFRAWISDARLVETHFHAEPACFSGRFKRPA